MLLMIKNHLNETCFYELLDCHFRVYSMNTYFRQRFGLYRRHANYCWSFTTDSLSLNDTLVVIDKKPPYYLLAVFS